MKKLRLNPDDLRIEPFEVQSRDSEADGTVHGNDFSGQNCPTHPAYSCGYPRTCGGTSCDTGYPLCYQCTAMCNA